MKFKERLSQGTLIKRYKRFFVDIKYKNKIITAHCPNTGSMMGLLNKGNKTFFSKSSNPKRKLKYSLEIIEVGKNLVGINTLLTNKLVFEALNLKKIKNLIKFENIKTEVKFSNSTRFDFLISLMQLIIDCSLSSIILTSATLTPRSFNHFARKETFIS